MKKMAWHYTVGEHAGSIILDGNIQPATVGVPVGERPCVWFSSRQFWEPTANKGLVNDSGYRDMTFEEMLSLPGGLWRFGLPVDVLLDWRRLRVETCMSPRMAKALVKVAREVGSDPAFWYGAMEPVPVGDCVVQCLRGMEWQTIDPAAKEAAV